MKLKDLYQQRQHLFFKDNTMVRGGLIFLIVIGLATFAAGMVLGERTRTWGSLLFNAMFFFSIALGGVAFGNMQDVIDAAWGRPIKRIHESLAAFLPIVTGLFFVFLACVKFNVLDAGHVYKWIADPSMVEHYFGKNFWLQTNFMLVRDVLALLGILFLSRKHIGLTMGADKAIADGRLEDAARIGASNRTKLRNSSPVALVLYAILYSILSFDLFMSLTPHWVSTLWAGWQFAIMMQTLMATILLILFALKTQPVGQYIGRQQFHDVGKLLFGFTAFYAYLTYAHVLTYWYTNIPEETSFFITRLQKPWVCYVILAPFLSFLVPFILMVPKASKWTSFVAIPVCCLVLFAQLINMMLVVIPEQTEFTQWTFPWIEMGLSVGFIGAFIFAFIQRGRCVPLLSLGDPLLYEALNSHH